MKHNETFICLGAPLGWQLSVAGAWKVVEPDAIIDEVLKAARNFAAVARKFKVRADPNLEKVQADVRRRISSLRPL